MLFCTNDGYVEGSVYPNEAGGFMVCGRSVCADDPVYASFGEAMARVAAGVESDIIQLRESRYTILNPNSGELYYEYKSDNVRFFDPYAVRDRIKIVLQNMQHELEDRERIFSDTVSELCWLSMLNDFYTGRISYDELKNEKSGGFTVAR